MQQQTILNGVEKRGTMRTIRLLLAGVLVAGAVGGFAATAAASPASSPEPVADTPSCGGVVVAYYNHEFGPYGASENPNSSGGPGYSLGPDTQSIIEEVRALNC